jgi:D-alanine transaminase
VSWDDPCRVPEPIPTMPSLACLNGEFLPPDAARVPIWDRGFLFGDAVYEVCRVAGGRSWLEREHLERLRRSLAEIRIEGVDLAALADRMRATIQRSGIAEGTIYVQITRGVAARRHAFPRPPVPPTELIVVQPYDDAPTAALRESGVAAISHPDLRWARRDIKSTNLLANVLANEAAHASGAAEAILVDGDGFVTEATHSSVLWVRGGAVEGSPEGPGILPGTTRGLIRRLVAEEDLAFREACVTLDELKAADEVFLAATTSEVLPVVRVDGTAIGAGRPGPVAQRLGAAFREAMDRWRASGAG